MFSLRGQQVEAGDVEKSDGSIDQIRGGESQKTRKGVTQKTGEGVTEREREVLSPYVCEGVVATRRGSIITGSERRRRSCGDGKKRVRFSVSRMDCDTNFKVTMSIKKESDGVPVFFKVRTSIFVTKQCVEH